MKILLQPASATPIRRLTGVCVLSTGSYVPEEVVGNESIDAPEFDPQWLAERTGILERRRAAEDEATSDLAYEAARQCLQRAGVEAEDVDLVLVGASSPDRYLPSTATALQARLGAGAAAMDVQAACTGFLYALVTAAQFVANGTSRRALVVGADCVSRLADPNDRGVFPLFGDGAAAALLGPGKDDQGLLAYELGSDGAGQDWLYQTMGGSRTQFSETGLEQGLQYLRMDGRALFKWSVKTLRRSTFDVLRHAEVKPEDVALFALHQTNRRLIETIADSLGAPIDRFVINLDRFANTSAAAVPLALDEAASAGMLSRGDLVLLAGFGAGLTWGTMLLRW